MSASSIASACLALAALVIQRAPHESGAADDALVVRQERFGFEIARPSVGWGFSVDIAGEKRDPEKPLCTLSLFDKEGAGLPSVVVFVSEWDAERDLAAARGVLRGKVEAAGVGELVDAKLRVGPSDVPSLSGATQALNGKPARVEFACVARAPFLYVLQAAWAPDDARGRVEIERCVASLVLRDAPRESDETADLRVLAARCGSEIDWAPDWATAAARAKEQEKLVWVAYEVHAGLELPATQDADLYTDPELVALVRERFVALHFDASSPAPFREADVPGAYGMGEHTWGSAILWVTPDARVLRTTCMLDVSCVHQIACDILNGEERRSGSDVGDRLTRAELHVRRGELAHALEALKGLETWPAAALRARVHRLRRDAAKAASEIRDALQKAPAEFQGELLVEKALILLRSVARSDAAAAFTRALEPHGAGERGPRVAEALFWLGALDVHARGLEAGSAHWKTLIAEHRGSPWAWRAAANLLGQASTATGGERLSWPEPDVFASLAPLERAPLAKSELARVKRDALAYLLRAQQSDGSWASACDRLSDPALVSSPVYTPAITAVCAEALLAERAQPDVERALRRARDFLEAYQDAGKLEPSGGLLGVYSIWGRAWTLAFFARCRTLRFGDREELEKRTRALVVSTNASQHGSGGWPYVTFADDPTGSGIDPSTSFLSAGVLLALYEAKAGGVAVEERTLERALAFLEKMQCADGSFRYLGGVPDATPDGPHPEAAGRGPVCALALFRGGKAKRAALEGALERFLEHKGDLKRQWRKDLCHTGPEGQGSHYLFFDYRFAAAALRELPPDARRKFRGPLLADVLEQRLSDGSFEDIPLLGRAYGTAMALMALADLERE